MKNIIIKEFLQINIDIISWGRNMYYIDKIK